MRNPFARELYEDTGRWGARVVPSKKRFSEIKKRLDKHKNKDYDNNE